MMESRTLVMSDVTYWYASWVENGMRWQSRLFKTKQEADSFEKR